MLLNSGLSLTGEIRCGTCNHRRRNCCRPWQSCIRLHCPGGNRSQQPGHCYAGCPNKQPELQRLHGGHVASFRSFKHPLILLARGQYPHQNEIDAACQMNEIGSFCGTTNATGRNRTGYNCTEFDTATIFFLVPRGRQSVSGSPLRHLFGRSNHPAMVAKNINGDPTCQREIFPTPAKAGQSNQPPVPTC